MAKPRCPQCSSKRLYRDGIRYLADGTNVQRWLCRNCGYRFTDQNHKKPSQWKNPPFSLNPPNSLDYNCRGNNDPSWGDSTALGWAVQTLATVEKQNEKRAAGATGTAQQDVRGAIVQFMWWLKKEGYSDATIQTRVKIVRQLVREGCNVFNPDDVKKAIAVHEKWSPGHKQVAVHAYSSFAEMLGIKWDPPDYKHVRGLPFIPLESDLDTLISGCSRKVAAVLQLLKETGMRIGEAWRLKWTDIDDEQNLIRCRAEKGGNPRIFKVSGRLISMLKSLPKTSEYVFGGTNLSGLRWSFDKQKKRLATKLQNPRLLTITFHSFRHWKATMEYHKTKDILYVRQLLGHKRLDSTLVYTQLVDFKSDEYYSATAKTTEEARELIESGFEYVCTTPENIMLFRKRK